MKINIVQDFKMALPIIQDAGKLVNSKDLKFIASWRPENLTADKILTYNNIRSEDFFVLTVDGDIAAAAVITHKSVHKNLWDDDNLSAYIYKFSVAQKFRGQNIADIFLGQIKEMLQKKNIKKIRIDVAKDKTSVINMYKRNGFEFVRDTVISNETITSSLFQMNI